MNDILLNSLFFGVMVSFVVYEIGMFARKKCGFAILNPLLFSIVVLILLLAVFDIDYEIGRAHV